MLLRNYLKIQWKNISNLCLIQVIYNNFQAYILNSVVQDVKDFSLILSKCFTLSIKKTKISTIVNQVTSLFANQIQMKGLTITKYSDDAFIHTDGSRVKQALINLVQNAQKFTFKVIFKISQGGITITAKLEITRDTKFYKISVQDTGPGMSVDTQEKILKVLNIMNSFQNQSRKKGQEIKHNLMGWGYLLQIILQRDYVLLQMGEYILNQSQMLDHYFGFMFKI
ncbi:hypothetical protein FGO68_gene1715 [Halteria grandinella]|uniref:Histidine kinase domain-containing protein n=1 Tax=Halteria grandinella TaxID=5974 RepID=A0A8J8SYL5_HALGN|nr:hypothetical protein FGO68_gene1715 [Halteria grandinella]